MAFPWSTIPAISYFIPQISNYLGETKELYFAQIEKALTEGWSAERIRKTYRWLAVEDAYSRIDISDSYREQEIQVTGHCCGGLFIRLALG